MELTTADIREFKSLYKKYFDVVLDDAAARSKLSLLVLQIRHTFAPITEEQLKEFLGKEVNGNGVVGHGTDQQ